MLQNKLHAAIGDLVFCLSCGDSNGWVINQLALVKEVTSYLDCGEPDLITSYRIWIFNLNKYSKNYLNHLFNTNEILASLLLTLHNINFYHELISPTRTYICLDYQDTQLLNLTKDSTIQVNCLGNKFEEFCKNRPIQKLEEI